MTQEQTTEQEEEQIQITMEDLNILWGLNPLAKAQFQNIIDAKQIQQLRSQISELSQPSNGFVKEPKELESSV
jgi:hypothetical protein